MPPVLESVDRTSEDVLIIVDQNLMSLGLINQIFSCLSTYFALYSFRHTYIRTTRSRETHVIAQSFTQSVESVGVPDL